MARLTNNLQDYSIEPILMDKIITQLELRENEGVQMDNAIY
jgi:hypothetical protein